MAIKRGDLVKVKAFENKVYTRRLVSVESGIAVITTSEEYELAAKEQREPVCIGFPASDVEGAEGDQELTQ